MIMLLLSELITNFLGVYSRGKYVWLNTAPSFSSAKILRVLEEMATIPSAHCSVKEKERLIFIIIYIQDLSGILFILFECPRHGFAAFIA